MHQGIEVGLQEIHDQSNTTGLQEMPTAVMKLIPVMAALESFKSSFLCTSRHMGAIQLTPSVVRTSLERLGDVQALVLQRTVHAQNFARHFFLLKAFNKIVPENKHVYIHVCQFCVLCQYPFCVVTCFAEVGDM